MQSELHSSCTGIARRGQQRTEQSTSSLIQTIQTLRLQVSTVQTAKARIVILLEEAGDKKRMWKQKRSHVILCWSF